MEAFDAIRIDFVPLLPWPVLGGLTGVALIAVLAAAILRAPGWAWRFAALFIPLLALANPSLVRERREPIRDVATIVVDRSPSQRIGDRTARTDAELERLQAELARFEDLDVRVVEAARLAGGDAASQETRLFGALDRALADLPRARSAGAFLITDGQVHDVPANPTTLAELGPVHTLLTGERGERDRRLVVVQAPTYGIVGKPVEIVVRVEETDGLASGTVTLSLAQDGGQPREVALPVGEDVPVTVTVAHGGQNVVELAVAAVEGEITLTNNRAALAINGVRDRLRVLLISGAPHAGERTWRNLLKADPSVDLIHFTILRPPEKQDGTPINELSLIAFPIQELFEIKINEFDLIIFDRYRRQAVIQDQYLYNIAEYVRNGGALLEASGPDFATGYSLFTSPLGEILPAPPTGEILEAPFRPAVSELGRRHPVTAALPGARPDGTGTWGPWFQAMDIDARSGTVVMTGPNERPLLVLDRVGEGRVAQLASDQIWLWSRGYQGGGPQGELLRRLAHWLMKEPDLEENDLRARADGNTVVVERRRLEPDGAPVTVTSPGGVSQTVALTEAEAGWARATLPVEELGVWRASDGEKTAFAVVGAINPRELRDVRATPGLLAPVTAATGGGVRWLADDPPFSVRRLAEGRDMAGGTWLGLRRNGGFTVSGVDEVPLLPAWLVLTLALAAIGMAWWREGR